eukprot:TRINITY_DN1690_c0_g1_i6.p2 TRINITY_DN1690_c0_g1~~TRINITY_DN1690_c0_g1_i6.p2  ORF type:complete len:242 (-),score=12.37 TRINITY_DN1690_c0_g1_i6:151-876(-)
MGRVSLMQSKLYGLGLCNFFVFFEDGFQKCQEVWVFIFEKPKPPFVCMLTVLEIVCGFWVLENNGRECELCAFQWREMFYYFCRIFLKGEFTILKQEGNFLVRFIQFSFPQKKRSKVDICVCFFGGSCGIIDQYLKIRHKFEFFRSILQLLFRRSGDICFILIILISNIYGLVARFDIIHFSDGWCWFCLKLFWRQLFGMLRFFQRAKTKVFSCKDFTIIDFVFLVGSGFVQFQLIYNVAF